MLLFLALACSGPQSQDDAVPVDTSPEDTEIGDTDLPDAEAVTLTTRDGVTLVGDYYGPSASDAGTLGVVLLHMIPPTYDRTTWPADFVQGLREKHYQVLAIDRRGAGDSGGVAEEAYQGEKGRYDVEAADAYLREKGVERIVLIGASNGTTSALDFSLWSVGEADLKSPEALVLMTGGGYTENNADLGELDLSNVMFTYSTDEKAWSVGQQDHDPGTWLFKEYPGGGHGTKMFAVKPEVGGDILGFLSTALP
jgi:pimeloyl-ACP methyl ester carboxylesterase